MHSAAGTVQVSYVLRAVRFSCLLRGRGTSFQDDHGHNIHYAAGTVQVSYVLRPVRFSCLLRGRGTSFQDGVAAGEILLRALFEVSRFVITE
jgi:hypothetical protein